jgi:hypothetical protein
MTVAALREVADWGFGHLVECKGEGGIIIVI